MCRQSKGNRLKYKSNNPKIKFMTYDFFGEEWSGNCGACYKNFYAPTKYEYKLQVMYHGKSSECIGGW